METLYLPSCKIKKFYPHASECIGRYLENIDGIHTLGCCKEFCGGDEAKRQSGKSALVLCNNCAAIMEESSSVDEVHFVYEIIDSDPDFPFPDYGGRAMALQDCWRAFEKRDHQDTVRSLLRKMNIDVVELPENHEHTRFCGYDLLGPCTEIEKRFAPQRYAIDGAPMYTPMEQDEKDAFIKEYCDKIPVDDVVCYCMSCLRGIIGGGKHGVHLVDLLFPTE